MEPLNDETKLKFDKKNNKNYIKKLYKLQNTQK